MKSRKILLLTIFLGLISLTIFINKSNNYNLSFNQIQDYNLKDEIFQNEKPTLGEWVPNGINVCNATYTQSKPELCSDGAGGAIIVWIDRRSGDYETYAQNIDVNGTVKWTFNGVKLCSFIDTICHVQICSDGVGGAIVVIEVDKWSAYENDLYAQRIDSNGNVQWGANGVHIISTKSHYESVPQICTDQSGGAIISWQDERGSNPNIYAQRLNSAGTKLWGLSGRAVCSNNWWDQENPTMCSDGAGGALIAWRDRRNANWDIFAQRFDSNGNKQWSSNGRIVHNTFDGIQRQPKICSDESGGAIIVWKDKRDGTDDYYDLYAQRISSEGSKSWSSGGELINLGGSYMTLDDYNQQLCSDGAGGAIITWREYFGAPRYRDISAQHIDSIGDLQWGANGKFICDENENQYAPQICEDGNNGSYITWYDYRDPYADVYAQYIDKNGIETWDPDGLVISHVSNQNQKYPKITATGEGAIIAWGGLGSITAQYISKDLKPVININLPKENDLFGTGSPYFNLKIISPFLDTIWYTLDDGLTNYTFNGNDGKINQVAWDACENGTVIIKFYANNTLKNFGSNEITVRKDTNLPEITIKSPTPYQLFGNNTLIFNLSIDESNLNTTWYSLNDGLNYTFTGTTGTINQAAWDLCGNGTVNIKFYANDSVGNIAFKEVIVRKDINIPQIIIISPKLYELFGNTTINFELSLSGDNLNTTWYSLNSGINYTFSGITGTIDQAGWDLCANGSVTIKFYANDTFGNEVFNQIIVYKDCILPVITIISPTSYQLFGNATLNFKLSIDESNLNTTWYSLNDGLNYTFTGTTGTINQAAWDLCGNGTVNIKFYANDSVGNIAFKEVIVRKDINIPQIIIISPKLYELFGNTTINFELSIDEPNLNTTWYSLNGGINHTFSGNTGTINQAAWDLCGNGTVTIRFYANDSMCNIAFNEVIVRKDNSALNIIIISPTPYQLFGNTTFNFELSIDEPNLNTTWYSLNGGINHTFSGNTGTINQAAWDLCGNGTVIIRFYANDTMGNETFKEVTIHKDTNSPIIIFEFSEFFLNTTKPEYFHLDVLVICTVCDSSGISLVFLCENSMGVWVNRSMIDLGNGNWTYVIDISSLGWSDKFSISFFANDTVGNIGINDNSSILYKIEIFDFQKPLTTISFVPHSGKNNVNESTLFTLTADDGLGSGISVIRYKINDSDWIEYNGAFNLSGYAFGNYLISYYATDAASNIEERKFFLVKLVEIDDGDNGNDGDNGDNGDNRRIIPGYNLILFLSLICVVSIFLIKRHYKFEK